MPVHVLLLQTDQTYMQEATFLVKLKNPRFLNTENLTELKIENDTIEVTIRDEASPGLFQFLQPFYALTNQEESLKVTVTRTEGSSGEVRIRYQTQDGTAMAGQHYERTEGELVFEDGVSTNVIEVRRVPNC